MKNLQLFDIAPSIPERLHFLEILSRNLWWSWNPDAVELFRRIDPDLWGETRLNPLQFLMSVSQERLKAVATDEGFIRHMNDVKARYEANVQPGAADAAERRVVAYFSLEYGLHESVRIYSGGLGVLSGDHLKSSSDLKLPLVGVGLLYNQGYFQQYLTNKGVQQERYPDNKIHLLPLNECMADGHRLVVTLPLPDGLLHAQVWRLDVGRVPLFLLDTNIAENPPHFRDITAKLYIGDRRMRLQQELLLGIGGYRALLAMDIEPSVCHLNEGHAAFLTMARISHLMQTRHLDRDSAFQIAYRSNVFTTHTPVPAGNETFPYDLLKSHLDVLQPETGIPADEVINWARPDRGGEHTEPCMTILGLRTSLSANGVSQLHGQVARRMWSHLWPDRPVDEVPIAGITNGVHVPSWMSPDLAQLFDHYLGPNWRNHPADPAVLNQIMQLPDDELWHVHEIGRARLVRTVRDHGEKQLRARNATERELAAARTLLDHSTLTIGFARRFATYKRATLLLKDVERLVAILANAQRPVQLVFSGKAHPADHYGKDFIRQIVEFTHRADVGKRVVFLENYDIYLARRLVQGVDVWLNTPRRPQEASGTSGMKAALNGALNASVLDGWWCEGYSRACGWAIGSAEEHEDHEYQDAVESQALYNLIENEIVPCYYDRPGGEVPAHWVRMMKASLQMALGFFTSHRMVAEYAKRFYEPAVATYQDLVAHDCRRARDLVAQRQRLRWLWGRIRVGFPTSNRNIATLHVGDHFTVSSVVDLGELAPADVAVQLYHGTLTPQNQIQESKLEEMAVVEDLGGGRFRYEGQLVCQHSGRYGFTVRAVPQSHDWRADMPGFMTWAEA